MARPNTELTSHQKHASKVLAKLTLQLGHDPSVRQFAEALGVTHGAAHQLMRRLEARGVIRRTTTAVRLKLTPKGKKS